MKQLASTATGIKAVVDLVQAYDIQPSQDGLEFVSPDDLSKWNIESVSMPERLHTFLTDIRLLRRIPISYLVPDPDLLPPESIRFFHVNQTWVDRVIDGVFSNTNIGTVDFHYNLTTLQLLRASIDPDPGGRTGLLIRSELTRRWPKMIVKAFTGVPADVDAPSTVKVLRSEAMSRDIFIALFAGQPKCVHIREPFEGVRFGVETSDTGSWEVDQRTKNGVVLNADQPIAPRNAGLRTLDISGLRASLFARDAALGNARGVVLHLEQRPFVQVFLDSVSEIEGSKEPPADNRVLLRNGKLFTLQFATQALFHQNP